MSHYKRMTYMLLVLAMLFTTIAIEPWIHSGQVAGAISQPVLVTQASSEKAAVQKAVLQYLNCQGVTIKAKLHEVAIADGFALVGWTRGEMGGNTLLKQNGRRWEVITSGGGYLGLKGLQQSGVPQKTAEKLLNQYDPNWRKYQQ
ncbi:hypothetical protein AB3R30_20060 [Leptolyngbyaceae cyanobacterium UHCC 1019]